MSHYIIPIFISHLGCPHTCIFCNQSRITAMAKESVRLVRGRDVLDTAQRYLSTLPEDAAEVELSFYGGTFTGIPVPLQEELLGAARALLEAGKITHIRCSTRPDFIDEAVLTRCKVHGMDIIELGVQSLDDDVLRRSGRGHDAESVARASRLIKAAGLTLGHQVMPGLPGATPASDLETARRSAAMGPGQVRIYPTLVVRDTPLADLYLEGAYQPYGLEEAVVLSGRLMEIYEKAGVQIIRVGLQATEEISPGGSLLAGPHHPAFRELVLSCRLNQRIRQAAQDEAGETFEAVKGQEDGIAGRSAVPTGAAPAPAFAELRINPKDLSVLYADKKRYFNPNRRLVARVVQDPAVARGQVMVRRQEGSLFKNICI